MTKSIEGTTQGTKPLYGPYNTKDEFYEGMVLSIEEMEFNTDTQEMEYKLKWCQSYNDL
jgi:hypothetical protein